MISRFKQLSDGNRRLFIFLSIIFALIIQYINAPRDFLELDEESFWIPFIGGWILFWIIARTLLWIYDGYVKKDED